MARPPQHTIGGSSVAAILGYSPFQTAHDVWARIVHGVSVEENDAMRRGTRLESVVCDLARDHLAGSESLSVRVPWDEKSVFHPNLPMFHGTVDGLVYSGDRLVGVLEIKTTTNRKRWNPDRPDYNLQGQHYLWVYNEHLRAQGKITKDLEYWWLVCLQASDEVFALIETYEDAVSAIELGSARLFYDLKEIDKNYATSVIPLLIEWWGSYIEPKVMPPIDGSKGCTAALRNVFPERQGEIEATDAIVELARERHSIGQEIAQLEVKKREADNKLRGMLGSNRSAFGSGVRVTISNQSGKMKFDKTMFAEEHPDLYGKYTRKGADFDQMRVTISQPIQLKEENKESKDV